MKNKRKLFAILTLNDANTMLSKFINRLSFDENVFFANHCYKIERRIANAK